jgi:MFS family permease
MRGCFAGWALDAFDAQAYSFVIPALIATLGITTAQAGMLSTAGLIGSAVGGWLAGILSDRFGRVFILQATIVWFSVFSFLSGLAWSSDSLLVLRILHGLGFGGEWTAGSVLLSEVMRPHLRARAMGLVQSGYAVGWGVSTLAYTIVFSTLDQAVAWRVMFWLGILPCGLIIYIRRSMTDSEVFETSRVSDRGSFVDIFKPRLLRKTTFAALAMSGIQGGYYCVATWLLTYLKLERHLTVLSTGTYFFVLTFGALCGFLTTGYLGDKIGRKWTLVVMVILAGTLTSTFTILPIDDSTLLVLGFFVGLLSLGISGSIGAFLSELFPTNVRASGQGFAYNVGRGIGALYPTMIGIYAAKTSLGGAISTFSLVAYGSGLVALLFLPETRGQDLSAVE